MPDEQEHLQLPASAQSEHAQDDPEGLRLLSRSPHPYHRQNYELLHPSDQLVAARAGSTATNRIQDVRGELRGPSVSFTKESTPTSDSGTEADDEHFLKGLPAPKTRLHKGLRGRNELLSGSSSPLLAPIALGGDGDRRSKDQKRDAAEKAKYQNLEKTRRRKEIIRRCSECLILALLGALLYTNANARPLIKFLRTGFNTQLAIVSGLLLLYPIRVALWAYMHRTPSSWLPIAIPPSFEPAPLLYPLAIPLFVSLLVATTRTTVVLLNLSLSISAMPKALVPLAQQTDTYNNIQWVLSCLPYIRQLSGGKNGAMTFSADESLNLETIAFIYPLHQTFCAVLQHLTTTSLLPAELQLLSIALINILFLARSPQAVILKGLLWLGGLGVLVLCGPTIRWGITLARVPKWRFRRQDEPSKHRSLVKQIIHIRSMKRFKHELLGAALDEPSTDSANSSDDEPYGRSSIDSSPSKGIRHAATFADGIADSSAPYPARRTNSVKFPLLDDLAGSVSSRRNTLPDLAKDTIRSHRHTPSGRRKRSASSSLRAFFFLTPRDALIRKWLYAAWVYICIAGIILLGIRQYVSVFALHGNEPIGWALGYLFGDLPWFRFQVVQANLERWVCLPERGVEEVCNFGWVEHLRQTTLGEANTRLVLSAYWFGILILGLAVVFKLSPVYEVDTRRKVFHFMMVAMFLPATFVDPTYAALALSLILAIFLLLDLLRASQLPPLSKPIASFLTPYVDGRDLRGPVVISHIFLLIGCAIPLWLSLGALPRTGTGAMAGWGVPTRDVSMVSGVICVGLGDAAASLIGRRWGHRKWLWGGGKSIEGSVAFAVAVFIGLVAAATWLRVGGWPVTDEQIVIPSAAPSALSRVAQLDWMRTVRNAGVCASVASLTEAVLTGGNDNVVVPVMLWTCVKGLGL